MPLARTEVAGAAWQGGVAVVGGFVGDGGASDRADLYSPTRNGWTQLPRLPLALHHAGVAVMGDRLYVVGGFAIADGQGVPSARVVSLGEHESAWRDEPPLPAGRGALAVAAISGRLIAAGGVLSSGPTTSTVVFRPGGGWSAGPLLARAREHLAATLARGRVYVIAGRAGGENFADVESWDAVDQSGWRVEPSLNDSRGGIGADTVAGHPCVAGGEEAAGTIASVECLAGDRWSRVAELARPRHGLVVAALAGRLHVIGGGRRPGLTVSTDHEAIKIPRMQDVFEL